MDGADTEVQPSADVQIPRRRRHWAWLGLLLLPLALTADFAHFLTTYNHYNEQARAGVEQLTLAPAPNEVIVVLTGDIGRIPRALELLRVRNNAVLIISGVEKGVGLTDLVNQQGAATANLATIWKKIKLESKSSSTVENALFTQELLGEKVPGRIVLVTSDYHMGRSLAVFRSVFPKTEIVPFAVASTLSGSRSFHSIWKTGAEYWKSLVYRLSLRLS